MTRLIGLVLAATFACGCGATVSVSVAKATATTNFPRTWDDKGGPRPAAGAPGAAPEDPYFAPGLQGPAK